MSGPDTFVPTDVRLDEMPMAPVACLTCGAWVLARKSSWNQTSVQWTAGAAARCVERAHAHQVSAHASRSVFLACSALGASIVDAVRHGNLTVVEEITDVAAAWRGYGEQ